MIPRTNPQIINHHGLPAFVIVEYQDYQDLIAKQTSDKHSMFPHEVVKMNVLQGMSLLKAWRTYFGMSQSELAKKAGVTQAQVANFENGKTIPRADTLLRLSNALNVNAELLWESDDDDDVEIELVEECEDKTLFEE
jgi:DNA-binding XRE family transcriptional regulator